MPDDKPVKPFRVAAVLQKQLTTPPGAMLPSDSEIRTTCPDCHTEQTLLQATVTLDKDDTLYTCRQCKALLVVVIRDRTNRTNLGNRGYRLGQYVIQNRPDLFLLGPGWGARVVVNGIPDAFDYRQG